LEEKLKIMSEKEKAKADLENLESRKNLSNHLSIMYFSKVLFFDVQIEKAVSSEEKFNKMKELYNKLKDEHVNLLRQVRNFFC
jgi:hypothetical protein